MRNVLHASLKVFSAVSEISHDLFKDEHFRMGNYIAVRGDESEFIKATKG